MGIGVGLSSIPCILLPFAILKKRGKMPKLHWDIAALPGLLCGAGWELGFIAAVLSTMSPLGERSTLATVASASHNEMLFHLCPILCIQCTHQHFDKGCPWGFL
jgi:hypothetical protein